MSSFPEQRKLPGRPKGSAGGITVSGSDGKLRKRSWRDVSPDPSSDSSDPPSPKQTPQEQQMGQTPGQGHPSQASPLTDWGFGGDDWEGPSDSGAQVPPPLEIYTHQLLSIIEGCLPPVLPSGLEEGVELKESTFFMPAFDETKGVLDYDSFAMPGVCQVLLVGGGAAVAHWCNCCPELELQKCIFSGVSLMQQEKSYLEGQAPQCLHLKALFKLGAAVKLQALDLCGWSDERGAEARDGAHNIEDRVMLLPFRGVAPKAALLGTTRSECVVVVEKNPGHWNCTECYGKGKAKCWHVQILLGRQVPADLLRVTAEQFEEQLAQDFDQRTGKRRLKCLSQASIPEAHKQDEVLANLLMTRGQGQTSFPSVCQIESPSLGNCKSCGRASADSTISTVSGTIFHLLAPVPTQVQSRSCPCGEVSHYDGRADGILNFNNKYLYSYEILQWYANQMWRTKVPFVSMWKTVLSMYAGAGVAKEALKLYVNQRQAFQDAFFDYITLLDIDFAASFRCACSPPQGVAAADYEPAELIGDGITLGYRADLSFLISPWKADAASNLKTGSLHQNRTFVQDSQIRSALLRFSQRIGKAGAGLLEEELKSLQVSLENSSAKSLIHLLDSPQLQQDLLAVARKAYVEEPIEAFKKLRKRKLEASSSGSDCPEGLDLDAISDEERFLRTGHFFPNHPIRRQLPTYAADCFSQRVGPTCTKYKSQHKNLTPGMFPFFCIFCAMCVGFVVLPSAESPKLVFQTLFTRFRGLRRFIYDNVCHLLAYALNREPKWAGGIHWLIDRLHTVNHKDCSPAFGIDRYAALRAVNSQRSEQKNARLVNAKAQVAYMKQSNFWHYMRYYLHCLNMFEELGDF